ncbi:MAG: hypothetical protein GY769_18465 [bacterium]|nr:hypothetical protein [bacterium]
MDVTLVLVQSPRQLAVTSRTNSGRLALVVGLLFVWAGCLKFEQVDISDYPDVPFLAGRCIELQQPMFLVKRNENNLEPQVRNALVRPGKLFAPFSVDEYRSGDYEPDDLSEVLRLIEAGSRIQLDRVWDLEAFEGSIPALTAQMEHDGQTLTVNVIRILDDVWYSALDKGELHPTERAEVAGREILDARYARFCDEVPVQNSVRGFLLLDPNTLDGACGAFFGDLDVLAFDLDACGASGFVLFVEPGGQNLGGNSAGDRQHESGGDFGNTKVASFESA